MLIVENHWQSLCTVTEARSLGIPFLLCRSLVTNFLCHSLSIKEEERVYLVCIQYIRIPIHGLKRSESKVEDGSEYWA